MIKALAIAMTLMVSLPVLAGAQTGNKPTAILKEYIAALGPELEADLSRIGRGIEAANLWLKNTDAKPLYCPPEDFLITGKQYGQILTRIVEENPQIGFFEVQLVGMALVHGLRDTFPCPG